MAKVTKEKVTSCLKGSALTLATLAGVIGGVVFGLCLRTREGTLYLSNPSFMHAFIHIVWKSPKMSHSYFSILTFSTKKSVALVFDYNCRKVKNETFLCNLQRNGLNVRWCTCPTWESFSCVCSRRWFCPWSSPAWWRQWGPWTWAFLAKLEAGPLLTTCPPPFWQLFWASFSSLLFILGNPELKEMSQQRSQQRPKYVKGHNHIHIENLSFTGWRISKCDCCWHFAWFGAESGPSKLGSGIE